MNMHVISDVWCHIYCMRLSGDEMLLCWTWNGKYKFVGWLVIYIGMRLVCMIILCWLVRHDFGMV